MLKFSSTFLWRHIDLIVSFVFELFPSPDDSLVPRVFSRLSRNITGRAELQQSTTYFVKNHTVLSEHMPLNTLLTTKIIR